MSECLTILPLLQGRTFQGAFFTIWSSWQERFSKQHPTLIDTTRNIGFS